MEEKTRKILSKDHKLHIGLGVRRHLQNNPDKYVKQVSQLLSISKNHPYKCGWIRVLGKDVYYRSSYELEGLLFLNLKQPEILSFDSESVKISYTVSSGKIKVTVPDWLITLKNNDKYLVEVKPKGKLTSLDTLVKLRATEAWAKANNVQYCIWTEAIIFNLSSTTMSLEAILKATVAHQNGGRYSLNSVVIQRVGEKSPNRLLLQEKIGEDTIVLKKYCLCGCGEVVNRHKLYKRGHNRRGCPLTEETKIKIGKSSVGRLCSDSTRKKISEKNRGKLTGTTRSLETKSKISKTLKQTLSLKRSRLLSNSIIGS